MEEEGGDSGSAAGRCPHLPQVAERLLPIAVEDEGAVEASGGCVMSEEVPQLATEHDYSRFLVLAVRCAEPNHPPRRSTSAQVSVATSRSRQPVR